MQQQVTWTRVWGPAETFVCGDVEYEMGSTYESSDRMRVDMTYFVEQTGETFGVMYKSEVYAIGQEDDALIDYEWASAVPYYSLEAAIAACRAFANVDESDMFR